MKQTRPLRRNRNLLRGLFVVVGPLLCHGIDKLASTAVERLVCQLQLHAIDYSFSNVFDRSSEEDLQPEYLVTCSPVDTVSGIVSGELLMLDTIRNGSDALSMFKEQFLYQNQPYLSVSSARIHANLISIAATARLEIVTRPRSVTDESTSALPAIGTKRTLLLRVSTRDSEPDLNSSALYYHTFQSESSLARQMRRCSFGILELEPHRGGIWEVMLGNYNATDEDYLPLINAATSLVSRSQNVSSVNDLADLVFIILPGGTRGEWISFSTLSGRLSVFNNQWAAKASTLAHGFGHNFGLDHARRTGGAARVEETGFMGLADDSPEVSDKCFNAANYWDLGWVSERAMTLNVSEKSTSIVPLTSIVQVDPDAQDEVVVLKVEDLYILYNQAKRFNSDTGDLRNNVVIVRPVTWGTQLVAGLDVVQPLFTRTCSNGSTLMIELCRATAKEGDVQGATRAGNVTARPGQVLLSVGYNKSLCPLPIPTPTGPQTNASQVPPLLPGSPTVTSDDSTSESGAQSRASPRSIRIWISVLVACLGILAILAWVVYRRRRRRSHARCELSRPRSSYRKMDSTTFRSAGDNDDDDMSSCGDGLGSVGGVSFASESTRVLSNVTGTAAMTACTSTTVAPPNAAAAASSHQEPAPTTVRRSYYYSGGPNSRLPVSVHVPVVAVRPDSSSARYLNRDMTRSPVHPAAGAEGPRDAQSCARADWLFEEGLWGASEI